MSLADPLETLQDSLRGAPIIWKGDYPYFIHPISDGIPRMEAKVLRATRDLIIDMVDIACSGWGSNWKADGCDKKEAIRDGRRS